MGITGTVVSSAGAAREFSASMTRLAADIGTVLPRPSTATDPGVSVFQSRRLLPPVLRTVTDTVDSYRITDETARQIQESIITVSSQARRTIKGDPTVSKNVPGYLNYPDFAGLGEVTTDLELLGALADNPGKRSLIARAPAKAVREFQANITRTWKGVGVAAGVIALNERAESNGLNIAGSLLPGLGIALAGNVGFGLIRNGFVNFPEKAFLTGGLAIATGYALLKHMNEDDSGDSLPAAQPGAPQ